MHQTRAVDFLGRRTPIVYQNNNGPCPLLAICELPLDSEPPTSLPRARSAFPAVLMSPVFVCAGNVLLLKNVISLNPDASEVS
jgi:hypothetical protein